MKKIVLLFFALVILSCSKENNDNSLTTDPIIGIWVDSSTGGNSRGMIVIESNGIALSAIEGNNEVIFSDNFNKMTFGDFIGLRQNESPIYESQGPTD